MNKYRFFLAMLINCVIGFNAWAQQSEGWQIEAKNIDPNNYYGITSANGMIGLVSSPEPMVFSATVLNGAYDQYGRGRVSNILKGFDFANMRLDVDGQLMSARNTTDMAQSLDLKTGMLVTTFNHEGKVKVKHEATALRHLPFSVFTRITVTALKAVTLIPSHRIEAPDILRDVKQYYSVIDRPHVKIPLMTSVANSPSGKHLVAASSSYLFDGHEHPRLIHEEWDHGMHLVKFKKALKKGETFTFSVVSSACTTAHFSDPHNEAERLSVYAMLEGAERLLARHKDAWAELWKSDIQIEGDPEAQLAVRSALYHLYAFVREGTALSMSPMGLSGLGYNGHVFWDTELWMYPALLAMQPAIARSILDYRYERLEAAKTNAFAHGYQGAMYPWESADEGLEATPVWALTGPFEQHISGCIAWAAWQYFRVTSDKAWLQAKGYPMLAAIADFWVSRIEPGQDGQFHIRNVVGADEWAENIDDNAFTNAVAIAALRYAGSAANVLGLEANPQWASVADNIPILKFPNGVTKEHATYKGEMIKQADVNLLSFPLETIRDQTTMKKDLEYYEKRMSPTGPAMGNSVLSVLYNRLGNAKKSHELFVKGYKLNELPPFGVLAETAGGTNPYFATGAGGMLQAVIYGFGGLSLTDKGLEKVDSVLPKTWKSLTITGVGQKEETVTVK